MKARTGIVLGLALGAAAGAGLSNVADAAGGPLTRADVEKIVRDYIAAHGEEIVASASNAMDRAQAAKGANVVRAGDPVMGPASAPVTIIEFSDFQCPFCDRVQPELKQVRAQYGDKVRWVFKNMPLSFHAQARPAAEAALAAHKQGKFWEYSKEVWARQAQLGDKTLVAIAQELKLDMAKFEADRKSAAVKAQIDQDMEDAQAVGARGTPFFLINGQGVSGALPAADFAKAIDAALKAAKK